MYLNFLYNLLKSKLPLSPGSLGETFAFHRKTLILWSLSLKHTTGHTPDTIRWRPTETERSWQPTPSYSPFTHWPHVITSLGSHWLFVVGHTRGHLVATISALRKASRIACGNFIYDTKHFSLCNHKMQGNIRKE